MKPRREEIAAAKRIRHALSLSVIVLL